MERIKRNYDEASYRQLEMEIHNLAEARLAKADPHTHAAYHVQRGKELLAQNMPDDAEAEFRDAISTDYNNDAAHAQLAMLLEKKGDVSGARSRGADLGASEAQRRWAAGAGPPGLEAEPDLVGGERSPEGAGA